MNEQDLDGLIAAHGKGYNAPPDNPPLGEIRNRVHAERKRRSFWLRAGSATAAAAAVLLAVSLISDRKATPDQPAGSPAVAIVDPASRIAEQAIASALESADDALRKNPADSYYTEHLAAMKSNAEYFRDLQQRQAGGAI